jgi:LuxR family maltose regulon positive regulatory protein
MSAEIEQASAWSAAPLTKFRTPRSRRDSVPRSELLARLLRSVESNPLTLVCAPGGSGKTTLLTQLADQAARSLTVLWVALDADDNDTNRFFATLMKAVEPLGLAWETDPRALLANVAGGGRQTRAALAALVNALCTTAASRIVIILDDLHRLDRREIFELLESLIERLPDHVTLVLGSRVEPPLPLTRWRAHGELGAFLPADLEFSEEEALTLAQLRTGGLADVKTVRDALRRTGGWAVGLSMVLDLHGGAATHPSLRGISSQSRDRRLFSYLAHEVLDELPEDLREFVLQCSILAELSPALCDAVCERSDSGAILAELYRRNLFLTALDDTVPVLRFHDLFRDFLQAELEHTRPQQLAQLHERAARAEHYAPRAIAHFLKAHCWNEAAALMMQVAEPLLLEGGVALLERWIDEIPEAVRAANPELGALRGTCAWLRWDWPRAKREFTGTVDRLVEARQAPLRMRALFSLVDVLNSSGEREAAWERLEQVAKMPLDELGAAQLALQRAWCAMPTGDVDSVARYMQEFITHVERDPERICPATAERIHCMLIGQAGMADIFERFHAASESIRSQSAAQWHLAMVVLGGWASLWRGRRVQTQTAIEQGAALFHQFGGVRLVAERISQFTAVYHTATGNIAQAVSVAHAHIQGLHAPEVRGHAATWLRSYRHALARMYWVAGDQDGHRSVLPYLIAPRTNAEWPFTDVAAEFARGQGALFDEDWARAEAALSRASGQYLRFRVPMVYADPRMSLAYAQVMQGKKAAARETFAPVLQELIADQAVGMLVLEAPRVVDALFDSLTPAMRREPGTLQLIERVNQWHERDVVSEAAAGPLTLLTDREREVLEQVARGASNKHIARALSLSLHTVKRHIANILDKLDCDSRGRAADLFRQSTA